MNNENKNDNEEKNCFYCCDYFENLYNKHINQVIGKAGIGLSILGTTFTVLAGHYYIASVVVGTILNAGVLCGSLAFEKLNHQVQNLEETNVSLRNEKMEIVRRFSISQYNFPIDNDTSVGNEEVEETNTPKSTASTVAVIDLMKTHPRAFPDMQ